MEEPGEIDLVGITCAPGGYVALRGVGLSLARGQVLFAMGGAGSGKSVLLKTAAGILIPREGEVLFRGRSLERMGAREETAFRKASGFAFQDAALWANQSLYDNLALPARLHEPLWGKAEVDKAVRRAAELVGYDQDLRARPAELSTGERKLVGLARALVLDPDLLFLDDPVSGLDDAAVDRVAAILEALKARGRSVLVTSSSSELAMRFADAVAVLADCSLAAYGSYDEAVAWTDPRLRAVTGRLRPRARAEPAWAGSLAGAWADTLADDESAPPDARAAGWAAAEGPSLGDLINDVPDADDEADRGGREGQ
jgi:phospholipid/cholesterol/gamma-HCH transport system ATP-binding protein